MKRLTNQRIDTLEVNTITLADDQGFDLTITVPTNGGAIILDGQPSDGMIDLIGGAVNVTKGQAELRVGFNSGVIDAVGQLTVSEELIANGGFEFSNSVIKTANYTATSNDSFIKCNATSASFTINLPQNNLVEGLFLFIMKTDASSNFVVIKPFAGDTIEGSTYQTLEAQYDKVCIISGNDNVWYKINNVSAAGTTTSTSTTSTSSSTTSTSTTSTSSSTSTTSTSSSTSTTSTSSSTSTSTSTTTTA